MSSKWPESGAQGATGSTREERRDRHRHSSSEKARNSSGRSGRSSSHRDGSSFRSSSSVASSGFHTTYGTHWKRRTLKPRDHTHGYSGYIPGKKLEQEFKSETSKELEAEMKKLSKNLGRNFIQAPYEPPGMERSRSMQQESFSSKANPRLRPRDFVARHPKDLGFKDYPNLTSYLDQSIRLHISLKTTGHN